MLDTLRKPFFIAAVVLLILAVLAELGSGFYIDADAGGAAAGQYDVRTPGLGISYLAVLDGLLLFTIALIGAPLLIPDAVHGRIQGIVTLVVSFLVLIGSIVLFFSAIALLMLMVSLLLAIPFGTVIYMIKYASFDKAAATATLSIIMSLKIGFAVLLVLAHQRFLENKGLILITLTSFAATIILSFLHGFFPLPLVSLTDAVGAIITAILSAIWALSYLVGSIPSIIKVLRVDRSFS